MSKDSNEKYSRINLKMPGEEDQIIRVVNEGYTLFFNCQHLLIQLTPIARSFYDFLCEKMRSDNNEVIVDGALKEAFSDHISSITSKKLYPSVQALDKHLKQFKELGLLILVNHAERGFYIVNPKYAYKGGKGKRLKLLEILIKDRLRLGKDLKGLIDKAITPYVSQ